MPCIRCSVHVDLTFGTPREQWYAAADLADLPIGTTAHVRVPEGWPEYRVIHALAEAVARKRLDLRLEGAPSALRAWYYDLRDLVGHELASTERCRG